MCEKKHYRCVNRSSHGVDTLVLARYGRSWRAGRHAHQQIWPEILRWIQAEYPNPW